MGLKKVLICTFNYKPLVNPRSLRWTAIAEKMVSLGVEVHVVCNKVAGEKEFEVLNGVHVHRVGVRAQSTVKAKITKSNNKMSLLKMLYHKLLKHFIWPDSNFLWIHSAVKKSSRIITQHNISSVLSVSHPFSGHVVGYWVYKKHKNIHWALDIGDPFAFLEFVSINNSFLFKSFNFWFERKIIKQSAKQAVTTGLTKKEYLTHKFQCEDSMTVIGPLLRESSEDDRPALSQCEIHWMFIGTLYKEIRSPKYLLELFVTALNGDDRLRLHFYGEYKLCLSDFDAYQHLLDKKIFLHGVVTPDEVRQATQKANVLVNIGNKTSYQLPSKLVEYMAQEKFILNIKSIVNDSSEDFLKAYPLTLTLAQNEPPQAAVQTLNDKLKKCEGLQIEDLQKLTSPYKIDAITQDYMQLMSKNSVS